MTLLRIRLRCALPGFASLLKESEIPMTTLEEVRARFARGQGLPFADSLSERSILEALRGYPGSPGGAPALSQGREPLEHVNHPLFSRSSPEGATEVLARQGFLSPLRGSNEFSYVALLDPGLTSGLGTDAPSGASGRVPG